MGGVLRIVANAPVPQAQRLFPNWAIRPGTQLLRARQASVHSTGPGLSIRQRPAGVRLPSMCQGVERGGILGVATAISHPKGLSERVHLPGSTELPTRVQLPASVCRLAPARRHGGRSRRWSPSALDEPPYLSGCAMRCCTHMHRFVTNVLISFNVISQYARALYQPRSLPLLSVLARIHRCWKAKLV